MKHCPFCKSEIETGTVKCPYCSRTLIEKHSQPIYSEKQQEPPITKKPSKSRNEIFNNSKKYLPLVGLVVLIIIIWTNKSNESANDSYVPVVNTTAQNENTVPLPQPVPVPKKDPKNYVSLDNGTVLQKNVYYLKGDGLLNIENGTTSDAIAKLVNLSNNKSIYTVYIKANNTFQIKNISDATYRLVFNLGNDWNQEHKAFNENSSYEAFEDNFNFSTTDSQYTTFRVTLNPTEGGQAKTDTINPQEFGSY